jgi:solute carrier family 10 (sodium/bile acid cotransporter), member 7
MSESSATSVSPTTAVTSEKKDGIALSADIESKTVRFNKQHEDDAVESPEQKSLCRKLCDFYWKQEFLILVVIAIPLARAYPNLGADYLRPKYSATWGAVCLIFLMAGLSLKTADLRRAMVNMPFNGFVLAFNFGVVSAIVFGVIRALAASGVIGQDLADGMAVCGSLPVTVNMAIVFSEVSGADRAASVFTTAASNMSGVFISPLLILGYLGVSGDINLWEVFYKLALRVIVPMLFGQAVQTISAVSRFVKNNKVGFKRAQQYCLIFIIYTIFCRTLKGGSDNAIQDILIVLAFQFILLLSVMTIAWYSLKLLFPKNPKLRVAGLFGCTHKTISIGVPLITSMYAGHPNLGQYTLPILIWHPMQLVVGTLLMPFLQRFIVSECERLGIVDDQDVSPSVSEGTTPVYETSENDESDNDPGNKQDEENQGDVNFSRH